MSPISVWKQDHDSDPEISDDESTDPGESTLSSDIEEDDVDHHEQALLLGQAHR